MLAYALARGIPSHVLLSKADKLGRNDATQALATARRLLGGRAGVQMFSAESGDGVYRYYFRSRGAAVVAVGRAAVNAYRAAAGHSPLYANLTGGPVA